MREMDAYAGREEYSLLQLENSLLLENISLFSCQQDAGSFHGDDTRYRMTAEFCDNFKAPIDKPRCSRFSANPKHA